MTADPLSQISTRRTPQSEPADATQVRNSAGGYTFQVDDMGRLRRFLILGTEGGTYYAKQSDLTKDNATVVLRLAEERGLEVVAEVVAISTGGRAPKQNPALFALAIVAAVGDDEARKAALDALPLVARTGTHLFIFARYVEQFRGWGRGLRRAVGAWYAEKDADDLAYQMVKYRQREGWSHRDLLRLAHPAAATPAHASLYDWACGREPETVPDMVAGFRRAQSASTTSEWVAAIREHGLTWEMLPTEALNEPNVWANLLDRGMPQTALMRQLPRLTNLGLLGDMSGRTRSVVEQLTSEQRLKKARVHPLNVLVALRTYASGHGARGGMTWKPSRRIVDALDEAFYASFGAVEPIGNRVMLNLDVSGSMVSPLGNMPLTAREASAAMAMVTARTEPTYSTYAFTDRSRSRGWSMRGGIEPLSISPRQRLDDVIKATSGLPFAGTDCALPMVHALEKGLSVDTFVIYTDNETWAGNIQPHQALEQYRRGSGLDARLVVVGMTSSGFSIAAPSDPGMLDVVGFDTSAPNLIAEFGRGTI